jgi:hypothetical protein
MKRLFFISLFVLCMSAAAIAVPDKKAALDAIAVIETSHDGEALGNAIRVVINFAQDSPDVLLLVSKEATPWILEELKLTKDQNEVVGSMLLASYAAGSIKHQLTLGKTDENPYEGWLLALKSYEHLKLKIDFTSPGMEKLLKLQSEGKLKAYGEKLLKEKKW